MINKKQTASAIKAAVDQAKKVRDKSMSSFSDIIETELDDINDLDSDYIDITMKMTKTNTRII